MTRYLIQASYQPEGAKGLLAQGGTSRRTQIEEMITKLGGKLETFYFAFGETDVYAIAELPDAATAAAIGLTISGSGVVHTRTTVLLTAEEIDKAGSLNVEYLVPGSIRRAA